MKKIYGFALFTIGAAAGSLVTWRILKKKYDKLVREEIESVKEAFKNRNKPVEPTETETEPKVSVEDVKQYNKIIENEGYYTVQDDVVEDDGFESVEPEETEDETVKPVTYMKPRAISPEDFAASEDYQYESLTYFDGDKTLANEYGEVVDISVVGQENLDRIGEWEDDCIHVRDYASKTDFEILLDPRKYSEVYPERE